MTTKMDTITNRSTYDDCVRLIDLAVRDVMLDQAEANLAEDEVWCDMAAALLIDANRPVAREVCRVQLGFVPLDLLHHWERQDAARQVYELERQRNKAATRAQEKVAQEAAARESARKAIKDATCPTCFTVRSPSGACNC